MSIAAKHFDLQLGIDIHTYLIPPSPVPIPLPTPHIGMVFDPFDYLPIIGGTVKVNGVHKAAAGTMGFCIHIPVGGVWMPTMRSPMGVQPDDEIFMGSKTVLADGEPFSRLGMPVLDCSVFGALPPFRFLKPKKLNLSMVLPTAFNVAVPANVTVGGPPTVSWTALAFRAGFGALGALRKIDFKRLANSLGDGWRWVWKGLPSGTWKCKILRAEPVDIRDGTVSVRQEDFSVPGRLQLSWPRVYSSRDVQFSGVCGQGWQTPADLRLELLADGMACLRGPDELILFPELPKSEGSEGQVLDFRDGARLSRQANQLVVRLKNGLRYVFDPMSVSGVGGMLPIGTLPIQRITDACLNHWHFERHDGELVRIVESGVDGLQGRFINVRSRGRRILSMALYDPGTSQSYPLVSYHYAEGDLVAALDPLEAPRNFEYQQHRMLRHTDRTGLSFYYAYNEQWQVEHAWGDGGLHDYRFEYDSVLHQTEVTDSLGHLSVVRFDEYGLPLCEIDPLDGVTLYEYDDVGRTVAVVDPLGLRTAFEYDERGNQLKLIRPDGSTICSEYDADDKLIAVIDPEGHRWQRRYDKRGQLRELIDPLGAITRYDYNGQGQLLAQTDARQALTRLRYDRHGLVVAVVDALGHESRYEHDPLGNLLRQVDPLNQISRYEYDRKGRLLGTVGPDGNGVRCEYDAEDQLLRYVDEAGAETRLEYVGIGQIGKRIQADGHTVEYRYDSEEQLIAVINQRGECYQLLRDPLGRIVEEVDYWAQSRRYQYDAAGRLTSTVDPLGQCIAFATDKLGRITRKTFVDVMLSGRQVQEHFVYDKRGQLTELWNPAALVKRRFDPVGQMVEEEQNGFSVSNHYDEVGNRVLRETSAGNCVGYVYDLRGQAISMVINDEPPIAMERDALGRTTREQLSPHLQREFTYDNRNLLTSQSVLKDAAPLFETTYDYDCCGNLTRRSDSAMGVDEYRYNAMGRLLQHTDPKGRIERFLNDPAGDRLRTEVKQGQARKVVVSDNEGLATWTREGTYQGVLYVFDRAGDLVRKVHGEAPDDLTLIWDANHRMAESRRNGQSTYYGYDPLGRRVFKRSPTHTTWFFWDGNALLGDVKHANNAENVVPVRARNVTSLVETKRRQQQLEVLHTWVKEYVYYPGTFVPLATSIPYLPAAPTPATSAGGDMPAAMPSLCEDDHGPDLRIKAKSLAIDTNPQASRTSEPLGRQKSTTLGLGVFGETRFESAKEPASVDPLAGPVSHKNAPTALGEAYDRAAFGELEVRREADFVEFAPVELGGLLGTHRPEILYFINDANDSPVRVVDRNGQVRWQAVVSPWGAVLQVDVELLENEIRLQGQYFDRETGLSYNRNRYYDSALGAYVSLDPLGLAGSIGLHAYVSNPFAACDPLGLWGEPINGASVTITVGNVSRRATSSRSGHAEINGLNWFLDEGPGFDGQKVVLSDVVGHFKSGEAPIGVCTGCRSNIFDLLIDGNASSVVIPKTVGGVFQRNIEISSTEFERMSREIGSIYRGAGTYRQKSDEAWEKLEGVCRS